MTRPLLGVAGFLALGAWFGQHLAAGAPLLLLALSGALLALALPSRGVAWACLAVAGAAFGLGAAGAGVENEAYATAGLRRWLETAEPDRVVRLEGRLAQDPYQLDDRWILLLDTEGPQERGTRDVSGGRARIGVGGSGPRPPLLAGDPVGLWATLKAPRGFGDPGAMDAVAQARREGLHAIGYCKSPALVERLSNPEGSFRAAAAAFRAWARNRIAQDVLPGPEQGLVRAMLLGDRSGLDPDTEESFRIAGTYHVLALSGAQVALVAGVLLWGMRRLGIGPALTGVLASVALGFYAVIVGGDIPILRAVVTAVTLLLGRALDLDADLPNLVGLAAGGILVERPSSILDVSFELSFAATLGILWLAPRLAARLPRLPWRLDLALAGSFAAQVVLYPFLAGYFHRLAPAALLLNLVAVPLAGAVLLAGALLLGVSTLSASFAAGVGELAWILAHALLRSADVVRLFPWLDFRVPGPSIAASAWYVAGLGMLLLSRGRARLGWASLLCGAALILLPTTPRGDGRLHVTVLDVGQGDAIVVRTPHGHTFVIDAGGGGQGRLDLGEGVVSPYLWSLGIRHIDGLVLSHPHPDHVGGVPALLRNFRVDTVFEGLAPKRDPVYPALDALLRQTATVRLSITRGFRANWDGVSVEALAPQPAALAPWTTHNDDSVVLVLGFGQITTMLAGDVERLGESRLPPRHADLLKVPHHGSRTSSTPQLLAATLPRVAIVSAGYRNSFGHPHPEVVERYHRLGCQLLRTDRDGAITVSTDGASLSIQTFYDDTVPAAEWNTPPRGL